MKKRPPCRPGSTISKKGTFIEIDCPASLEIKADEELMGFLLEELIIQRH